eukprot:scaffold32893_cov23-Tisochrysis_lutea.AAC.2
MMIPWNRKHMGGGASRAAAWQQAWEEKREPGTKEEIKDAKNGGQGAATCPYVGKSCSSMKKSERQQARSPQVFKCSKNFFLVTL